MAIAPSPPQVASTTQGSTNRCECPSLVGCSRGRRITRADEKLIGTAVVALALAIILLSLGAYCMSSSNHCTKNKYGNHVNRQAIAGVEFTFGILFLIYAAAVGLYYRIDC